MTDDIVTRLRGSWLDNDCTSTLMDQAADEIERLRGMLEVQDEMVKHYVEERDAARQWICRELETLMNSPQEIAEANGWDCFKEKA